MDRAGKLIRGLKLPDGSVSADDVARAAWPQAVGKRIAARTRAVSCAEGRLIVDVDDPVWLQHLRTMSGQILPKLQEIAGRQTIRAIEFQPGVPRREPQRAGSTRMERDEADGIQDTVLRRLYKVSRSRSA